MITYRDKPPVWHPLACSGTAMQPPVLLIAKLAWALLVILGLWRHVGAPLAPWPGVLDGATARLVYGIVAQLLFFGAECDSGNQHG